MKNTLSRSRIVDLLKQHKNPLVDARELESLDDIPVFDNAEDEVKFWQHHTISQELLDQIPQSLDDQE